MVATIHTCTYLGEYGRKHNSKADEEEPGPCFASSVTFRAVTADLVKVAIVHAKGEDGTAHNGRPSTNEKKEERLGSLDNACVSFNDHPDSKANRSSNDKHSQDPPHGSDVGNVTVFNWGLWHRRANGNSERGGDSSPFRFR
jgi:hypothetical protein